ncbi:MAG: hypothetical protein E7Z62_01430 [Thermoplasmata archaeon]|nr:hypothetical protein [Thermoplasmata archaeon]
MLYWIPALAIALLAIFGVFRISREYVEESYSPIPIIISLTVGIICSMAVSCTFDGLLSPVVLGTQLATVGMGVLLIILSVAGGVKTNLPGIVMGLLVSVPIVMILIDRAPYYWMTAVASIATVATLLFWKKENIQLILVETDARKVLPAPALIAIATVSLCLTVLLFCTGCMIAIVEEFAHLSVFIGWSLMLIIMETAITLFVAKRISLNNAIALTVYICALDLFLGFLTSVVMWA